MKFDSCDHNWKLSVDAKNNATLASNRPWVSFYFCEKCNNTITLEEKCALDSLKLQKDSNNKQERSLKIAMWAMIV